MSKTTQRPQLLLDDDQRNELIRLSQSRTAPFREVQRAAILLQYAGGKSITAIKNELGVSRPTIYKCVDKALAAGVETGLKDKYHKPKDHGYAAETWTLSKPKFPQQKSCILLTSKGIGIKWISLYWEQSQQLKGPFL